MSEQSVSRFWDNFINKTALYGINPGVARWYVRHAEMYIKSNGKRLAEHSREDVDNYLSEKSRHAFIKDWQFQQIVTALKILFTDMVNVSWAHEFPWQSKSLKNLQRLMPELQLEIV